MKFLITRLCCGFEEESNHKLVAMYKCLKCGTLNPKIKSEELTQ